MPHDCGFQIGDEWFRYRAAAIIVEDGCVLCIGNERDDYLYSVGGGVHLGEYAEDAVRREILEETGVPYEVDRLAVIHENFFNESSGILKGLRCHEVAFYYWMKPRGSREVPGGSCASDGTREFLRWVPLEELDKIKAYPSFLSDYLRHPRDGIVHIVTDERT